VEVEFNIHRFCGRLTIDSKKEQRDLGNSGSTHKKGAFYSHEEYMNSGPVSSSIPRGDSATTVNAQFHSVESRHQIPVGLLVEAKGSIWDVTML